MTDGSQPGADDLRQTMEPGLADRLIGAILGRLIKGSPPPEEVMKNIRASRVRPSRDQEPGVLHVYRPEPGQEPAPAEVTTDPDLAERLPGLLDQEFAGLPPHIRRHLRRGDAFRFHAVLEEDGDDVVVRVFNEHIGRLKPADAAVYAAHLKAARLNGQVALALVHGSTAVRRPVRATVNFMQVATDDGVRPD